jgi:toxin ParE1/3/4
MKVKFSPAASDDLIEIASFIAEDNQRRALSFIDELEAACHRLGATPGLGTARTELGDGIRMWPHGRYLVFYREHLRELRIERILHGSRDIGDEDIGPAEF